ncbi:MAG: sigma-54-dependent Fis family transcriptional regulator [Chitinophagaceae bacterium]|nr:sigma-54-dependent Fis family transcriptional regulator [Chitinophagaceae bacterium]
MKRILIIDDDMDMCQLLSRFLQRKGYETGIAANASKGVAAFKEGNYDLVLCDFRLGDKDGVYVLKEIKQINPDTEVIIITGYSDIKMAVEVMKQGAFDYITKPLIPDEVLNLINKAINNNDGSNTGDSTNKSLKKETASAGNVSQFLVGKSPAIKEMYRQIETIAPTNYSVIIYGESGTGKEVVAKTIHAGSDRGNKPFVALDCGTLSKELAASELFGHVKGSFTGALNDKEGMFETANGGTLFLDEVANLPMDVQASLLRVIQERKFKRVGGNKESTTDVRIIVASNENLKEAYTTGKFREDLYHRFNEFSIHIPSLRNRPEDIPLFANFFLEQTAAELGKKLDGFEEDVMQLFLEYNWPGNLREFRNVIRRAGLLTTSGLINKNVLPWEIISGPAMPGNAGGTISAQEKTAPPAAGLKDAAAYAEYEAIMNVLKQVKFNKTKAAEILKIDRKTLYNKIKNFEESKL